MSPNGEETALAVMDDDGWGCAITSAPVTLARLTAYLNAKHWYEDLVGIWGRTTAPGAPVPTVVRQAGARMDALKEAAGWGGPEDPPCCQRYGFLHDPVFSRAGCRLPAIQVVDYHEHWQPGQPLVRHSHADGRVPHDHAAEPAWGWPAGKTFGELTPAERAIASRQAAAQLQAELERAAPAIAEIMTTPLEGELSCR